MKRLSILIFITLLLPNCGKVESVEIEKPAQQNKSEVPPLDKKTESAEDLPLDQEIFKAVENGDTEAVKMYFARGGDPNLVGKRKRSLMHVAAIKGYADILELLIENGADINSTVNRGYMMHRGSDSDQTPLHMAVEHGDYQTVKLLVNAGADVNAKDCYGRTPLFLLASERNKETVQKGECLIDAGADMDIKVGYDRISQTPFLAATRSCKYKLVELFLKKGANRYAEDSFGKTALDIAFDNRLFTELIIALKKAGCRTNHEPEYLLEAVLLNDIEKTKQFLKKHDGNICYTTHERQTPLHIAAMYDNMEIAEMFLDSDEYVNLTDWKNKTALDYAESEEMKKLFLEHGAKTGKELRGEE